MNVLRELAPFGPDALIVLGIFVMTAGVYGLARMPDIYTKVHAASKAVFLGAIALIVSSVATLEPDIILRVALIGAALLITTPIASHVIVKAAVLRGETMRTPGAINESDFRLLPAEQEGWAQAAAPGSRAAGHDEEVGA